MRMIFRLVSIAALALAPMACAETSDIPDEVKDLIAPVIDMEELQWLEGSWGVVSPSEPTDAACGTFDGKAYITFDMSDPYRPVLDAQPEPAQPDFGRVNGWSLITQDSEEPDYAAVTPRDWEDAYLKFRPRGEEKTYLEVRLFTFSASDTAWHFARTFYLEKCGT